MSDEESPLNESQEFIERKKLLEIEREIVELRHSYKMEELQMQMKMNHKDHVERMGEIRLKNRNIQRSIEDKDKRMKEHLEKKKERFMHGQYGEPTHT